MTKSMFSNLAILAVCAVLVSCAAVSFAQTPGEKFRRAMAALEADCKRDPPRPGDRRCAMLDMKPHDSSQIKLVSVEGQPLPVPQEWVSTPEGQLAHSIKLPKPLPKQSAYRPGMTSEEYFKHLCDTEAGEFILKTVDGVAGIYQMRPRREPTDYELQHLYAIEAPYDLMMEGNPDEPGFRFTFEGGQQYLFFETGRLNEVIRKTIFEYRHPSYRNVPPTGTAVARYSGYSGKQDSMRKEFDTQRKAKYGFTWRGIRREQDSELGIAGGELIVMDLDSGEVLAWRRNYTRSGFMKNATGVWWMTAPSCPQVTYMNPRANRLEKLPNNEFIFKVLKPITRTTKQS